LDANNGDFSTPRQSTREENRCDRAEIPLDHHGSTISGGSQEEQKSIRRDKTCFVANGIIMKHTAHSSTKRRAFELCRNVVPVVFDFLVVMSLVEALNDVSFFLFDDS